MSREPGAPPGVLEGNTVPEADRAASPATSTDAAAASEDTAAASSSTSETPSPSREVVSQPARVCVVLLVRTFLVFHQLGGINRPQHHYGAYAI